MGDDVAVDVDDVDGAVAHAGVADALEQAVDGDDGGEHAGKLAVDESGTETTSAGRLSFPSANGSLTKLRPWMLAVKARLSAHRRMGRGRR